MSGYVLAVPALYKACPKACINSSGCGISPCLCNFTHRIGLSAPGIATVVIVSQILSPNVTRHLQITALNVSSCTQTIVPPDAGQS